MEPLTRTRTRHFYRDIRDSSLWLMECLGWKPVRALKAQPHDLLKDEASVDFDLHNPADARDWNIKHFVKLCPSERERIAQGLHRDITPAAASFKSGPVRHNSPE